MRAVAIVGGDGMHGGGALFPKHARENRHRRMRGKKTFER
jgi:hypothetical protein